MKNFIAKYPFLFCILCIIPLLTVGCGDKGTSSKKQEVVAKKVIPKANKIPSAKSASAKEKVDAKTQPKSEATSDAEAGANTAVVERYNPEGKIDPFVPLFKEEQVAIPAQKEKKRRRANLTPLEKVDLSQLRLLGVILAPSGNRAMVSEVNGKGYVVTVGTYMGIASGRVVEILSDRIIVEEEVENILGKISLRKRELKLQKPAGE